LRLTERHGYSRDHRFAGVQIESQMEGVRDTPANRAAFAKALVTALESFLGLRNDRRPSTKRRSSW